MLKYHIWHQLVIKILLVITNWKNMESYNPPVKKNQNWAQKGPKLAKT